MYKNQQVIENNLFRIRQIFNYIHKIMNYYNYRKRIKTNIKLKKIISKLKLYNSYKAA